ncbi:hypothetical protein IMZ48_26250 [Candidatus Bathyarchaeota archaeon]|nr:hypothetical protein [Candidatus Bathyarchaeota archaeon]
MAEVTSALSCYDLVKEVALAAEIASYGSGNEAAMIPTDAHDLDRCLRTVNSAIRGFIAKAPPGGWRWRNRLMEVDLVRAYEGTASAGAAGSLTDSSIANTYAADYFNGYVLRITAGTGKDEYATVTGYVGTTGQFLFTALSGRSTPGTTSEYRICRSTQVIESDPARYLLSQDFQGEVTGDITFAADSNACGVEWTSEGAIRHARELSVSSGDSPFLAATLPYSTRRRWELIVDPAPSNEHTIVFPYRANFDKLTLIAGTAIEASVHAPGDTLATLTDTAIIGLYADDYFNGQTIRIISGTGKTSYAAVTDYNDGTGVFTVAEWLYASGTTAGTHPAASSIYYVEPADTHPAGLQFDDAIVSAILAQTELEFTDVKRGYTDKYLGSDLPAAWAIDGRTGPRKLGVMQSGSGPRTAYVQRDLVTYS